MVLEDLEGPTLARKPGNASGCSTHMDSVSEMLADITEGLKGYWNLHHGAGAGAGAGADALFQVLALLKLLCAMVPVLVLALVLVQFDCL
jgi:hypothetical protein